MNRRYKYRFKTLEEFESEFGDNWRAVKCSFAYEMNYLLGTDVDYECYKDELINDELSSESVFQVGGEPGSGYRGWNISGQMVKKIKIGPSYEPRKFIY